MNSEKFPRRDLFKRAAGAGLGILGTTAGAKQALAVETSGRLAKVPRTKLGSTGKEISILLMGCGQSFDPVYDKVLHRAFKEGVTYLDTSQMYGKSHVTLAPFIEQVGRENLWITSKVALEPNIATPEGYLSNLEKMLPDLRVDKLDMFFEHELKSLDQIGPEFIKMGQEIKKRGLADFFGFSCHMGNVVEFLNKAAKIGDPDINCIMFRYSFAEYGDYELNKAIDACKKAGIGLIAMKTQASVPEDNEYVKKFRSENFTLPQAKLKAVWADERIDAVNSHMTNVQQVKENTDAAKSLTQLTMRDFHELNRYAAATARHRCLGCSQICESRIDGDLRVADTLRYLMYAECYGQEDEAKALYRTLQAQERDFVHVDLAEATRVCPQGIDIPRRLADAHARLA